MRKVLSFLGASLVLALVVPAFAQTAPDQFKDVDTKHWAYEAMESLRSKGIVVGYPDGYFRGRRTLTRYEFAVALERALKTVATEKGDKGDKGDTGEAGPAGEPGAQGEKGESGISPEELANLQKLAKEFRDELGSLGTNVNAINAKLDRMAKDLAELKEKVDRMPVISGQAYLGIRGDRSNGGYVDIDGRPRLSGVGLLKDMNVVHAFQLGIDAKVAGGSTVTARLNSDNYKNYVGGNLAQFNGLNTDASSDFYIDTLAINTPFGGVGRDSKLTIGRFAMQTTPLQLWKPSVDSYLVNPITDDGKYRMDGLSFEGNFGSVGVQAFGAQTKTVQGTNGGAYNSPYAGLGTPEFMGAFAPEGQVAPGAMTVDQIVGLGIKVPVKMGEGSFVRLSAIRANSILDSSTGGTSIGAPSFTNVLVFGANTDLKFTDRINLDAEWSKTITGVDKWSTVNGEKNNAIVGNVNYKTGSLNLSAGYKYIDPMFYAPGYWGRIGNWVNPTNVQGPTFKADYEFSPSFGLNLGGEFFSGTRNVGANSLMPNDEVNRVLAGLRWDLSKNFRATLDWEGVYYGIDLGAREGVGKSHPTAQYLTIGTGYHLTENTVLKLGYQIGDFNGKGTMFTPAGTQYNYNTFTTQVHVKF